MANIFLLSVFAVKKYEGKATYYHPKLYFFFLIIALIFLCFSEKQILATTYYVSTSGNDSYPGSEKKPFRNLQKAADSVSPGDTVIAMDGIYTAPTTNYVIWIKRGGLQGAYVTFKSQNLHGAIIDGSSGSGWGDTEFDPNLIDSPNGIGSSYCILIQETAKYIKIEGFVIRFATSTGIFGRGDGTSNYIIIDNNIIHDNGKLIVKNEYDRYSRSGIYTSPLSSHWIIQNNIIHDNGRRADYAPLSTFRLDHGIYLQGRFQLVQNNKFYNQQTGWCIKVDGYYGDIGGSEYTHIIKNNRFSPLPNQSPDGGGYIRFATGGIVSDQLGPKKHPRVWIEGNYFYQPTGSESMPPIRITDTESSNYKGTVIKDCTTNSSVLYSQSKNISKNITEINNTILP